MVSSRRFYSQLRLRVGNYYKIITFILISLVWIISVIYSRPRDSQNGHLYKNHIETAISNNRNRFIQKTRPVNFTVLKDPYYVLQPNRKTSSQTLKPACKSVELGYLDFTICTQSNNDVLLEYLTKHNWAVDDEIKTIVHLVQEVPNAALIDIGAHIGIVIAPVMAATNNRVKIIAAEPMPIHIEGLIATMEANGIARDSYAIIDRAIADTVDETVTFNLRKDFNYSVGGIADLKLGSPVKAPFRVRTATLDSHVLPVARAMNITTAILKIDTEGGECLAIRKVKELLNQIYIPYIFAEHHYNPLWSDDMVHCLEEMHKTLLDLSYYPFYPFDFGPKRALDPKNYKRWGKPLGSFGPKGVDVYYCNVLWKKIF